MPGFVVDEGLDRLLAQINQQAPKRSEGSDGSIGDAAHRARKSDHNAQSPPPKGNPDRQVDARDFTHDPASGADMAEISEAIRLSRDARVAYVIFNKRIFSSYASDGRKAWEWGPYDGDNPHDKHMHVSVNDTHHDETHDWMIRMPESKGLTTTHWRLYGLLQLQEVIDNRVNNPVEAAPFVTAFLKLCSDVEAIRAALDADQAAPAEVTLTQAQLATLTDRVTARLVARLGALRFEADS